MIVTLTVCKTSKNQLHMNHLLNPTEHVVDLYLGLLQYLQQAVEGTRRIRIPSNLIKKKIAWIHNYL